MLMIGKTKRHLALAGGCLLISDNHSGGVE